MDSSVVGGSSCVRQDDGKFKTVSREGGEEPEVARDLDIVTRTQMSRRLPLPVYLIDLWREPRRE